MLPGSSQFGWPPPNDLCSSTSNSATTNPSLSDCKSANNTTFSNSSMPPSRRKSTSCLPCNPTKISNSNHLVLQQLRVALKKLPEAKIKPLEAVKRRHSDVGPELLLESGHSAASCNKKPKWIQYQRRPLSESISKGQGKITEYLPEMKHFIAMRKEKLDRVLNLGKIFGSYTHIYHYD